MTLQTWSQPLQWELGYHPNSPPVLVADVLDRLISCGGVPHGHDLQKADNICSVHIVLKLASAICHTNQFQFLIIVNV